MSGTNDAGGRTDHQSVAKHPGPVRTTTVWLNEVIKFKMSITSIIPNPTLCHSGTELRLFSGRDVRALTCFLTRSVSLSASIRAEQLF